MKIRYWSAHAEGILGNLNKHQSLAEQVAPEAFSYPNSPNWQDHSTTEQCEIFEKVAGGETELARMTGSKAHHVSCGLLLILNMLRATDFCLAFYRTTNPPVSSNTPRRLC